MIYSYCCQTQNISIHALREEGDGHAFLHGEQARNFYPRPPRGGRRTDTDEQAFGYQISIHALREEGDAGRTNLGRGTERFLSTPSARRATYYFNVPCRIIWISIHALREEGDDNPTEKYGSSIDFYPRPPRGGRRNTAYQRAVADIFLSTPSARRATACCVAVSACCVISIHALREEGDRS